MKTLHGTLMFARRATCLLQLAALTGLLAACETETPTTALVENAFRPSTAHGEPSLTLYRLWYKETLFIGPVLPGDISSPQRIVPGSDYAYALAAVAWDPSAGRPPPRLMALRSREKMPIDRGALLTIRVDDAVFVGNCFAGEPLSEEDAEFITERIFSAEFSGGHYDAATCTTAVGGAGGAGGFGGAD